MKKRTEPLGECSIESCSRTAKYPSTGWCQTHYHRWWRTGDPLGVKQERGASGTDNVNWKGDDVKYRQMHNRIKNSKGDAAQHDCVTCGKPANNWAYDHTDPDEKTHRQPNWRNAISFSTDIDHYQPMCHSCHVKLDRGEHGNGWQRKTQCINGHLYDEANTYMHPRGHQACRQCSNDRAAARRKLLRDKGLTARGRTIGQQQ